MLGVGILPRRGGSIASRGPDHRLDWQIVFGGESKIALIVGRHRHHRPFAITHKHIVGHPHRQLLAVERMHHETAGGHTLLLHRRHVGFRHAAVLAFLDESGERRVALSGFGGKRVLGGHRHIGRAHQGVGAGGVDLQDRVRGEG
jgi:hypothetical protein